MANQRTVKIALALFLCSLMVLATPGLAHVAYEDPSYPLGGNTWGTGVYRPWMDNQPNRDQFGNLTVTNYELDGLKDWWDYNNDTIPDLQYNADEVVHDGEEYTEWTSNLRMPVDDISPGLIFYDSGLMFGNGWEHDYARRDQQEPWTPTFWPLQGQAVCHPGWPQPAMYPSVPGFYSGGPGTVTPYVAKTGFEPYNDYCHGAFEEFEYEILRDNIKEEWELTMDYDQDGEIDPYTYQTLRNYHGNLPANKNATVYVDGNATQHEGWELGIQERASPQSALTWQNNLLCYTPTGAGVNWRAGAGPCPPPAYPDAPGGSPKMWPLSDWNKDPDRVQKYYYPGWDRSNPRSVDDNIDSWVILPAHPCAAHPNPNPPIDPLLDYTATVNAQQNGTVSDFAFGDGEVVGLFDAVRNLQTPFPSYMEGFSVDRWHINEDTWEQTVDEIFQNPTVQDPQTEIEQEVNGIAISPGHDGFVFGKMASPVVDGPGADIRVYELGWAMAQNGIEHGFYCVFGAATKEGPYYLIGTADGRDSTGTGIGQSYEDFDLAHFYNKEGCRECGGPVVRYVGIMPSMVQMHSLTADFDWTPWSPPEDPSKKITSPPVYPTRNEPVQFWDRSERVGHPTWTDGGDSCPMYCPPPCPAPFCPYFDPTDETPDPITEWKWTFDDPNPYRARFRDYDGPPIPLGGGGRIYHNFSWEQNPVHHFIEPGEYRVCLTVITDGFWKIVQGVKVYGTGNFTDTVCKKVPIYNQDPTASFSVQELDTCKRNTWAFFGNYTDPEDDPLAWPAQPRPNMHPPPENHTETYGNQTMGWQWDFGDGTPIQYGMNQVHTFPDDGHYEVNMTIFDKYGGTDGFDAVISTFTPPNESPVLIVRPTQYVPLGREVIFDIIGYDDPCQVLTYTWLNLPPGAVQIQDSPPKFSWRPTEEMQWIGKFEYGVTDGEFLVTAITDFIVYDIESGDLDEDGVSNIADNCPGVPNQDQADSDLDGIGDACEEPEIVLLNSEGVVESFDDDLDHDGIPDFRDNCVLTKNRVQEDLDGDNIGDACDNDLDGDGIVQIATEANALLDNCPYVANADQLDTLGNGIGDACDEAYQAEVAAREAAGCPGPFCEEERPKPLAPAPATKQEGWRGPFGVTAPALIAGIVVVIAALGSVALVGEGIRSRRLK